MSPFEREFKHDAPVSYATAKTGKALEFTDIALKWVCCISAKAARMRVLSLAGTRLRDFLAGPARTTVHSIEVLLKSYRIAARVRRHPSAVGARLGGRG